MLRYLMPLALIASGACSSKPEKADNADERVTLYSHESNGATPAYRTPGLLDCDPLTAYYQIGGNPVLAKEAQALFLPLPDANDNEGVLRSREERERQKSAVKFALMHNHAAFKAGKAQILRVCRSAKLVDF
ncbi:hypothetical protein SAMN05518849_10332 [Sphingobium sp. AP50]|uniref:hypothetical protein n=1 Tax=Sphingobium sp. AP50 TaxID=1884369 RepID=UPI0008ACD91B|nr:hypothetical protein [Sphingobium sp. AP50]SEJ11868.1 hypothetical protein SAMN05518849_10332 [Sphingobium sp. AP50]